MIATIVLVGIVLFFCVQSAAVTVMVTAVVIVGLFLMFGK